MHRKPLTKSAAIEPGSWVGIAPRCRTTLIKKRVRADDKIERLRRGEFVAVEERGDEWYVWDLKGDDSIVPLPTRLLRAFSETAPPEEPGRDWQAESLELFATSPIDPFDSLYELDVFCERS